MRHSIVNTITELLSSTTGKIGVTFLLVMLLISVYALFSNPANFGTKVWNNPTVWADNPRNVPPSWLSFVTGSRLVKHTVFRGSNPTDIVHDDERIIHKYNFTLDYTYDEFPTFTSFSVGNITYHNDPPIISMHIVRPDGKSLRLHRLVLASSGKAEDYPKQRYHSTPYRVHLTGDKSLADSASQFLYSNYGISKRSGELVGEVDKVIFGTPSQTNQREFEPLTGLYQLTVIAELSDLNDSLGDVKVVIGGSSFGMMGTDSMGRDLARGLIFGFPVALAIGLITAIMATAIGTSMGIISGYSGGKTDIFIQRSSDILSNIPLLPILLFLAFILGQKLWIVMATLIFFGWPGLAIVVRSMVLQIRSGQLMEASKSLGASGPRIMARHVFPQIAPFIFAQMIFFTPAAILAEAGLSFLGLGDPSIPTWGQILDQGFRTGAVYVGYWWWVFPPGLLIVATALTFVLIALGIEQVVDPRLRMRRE